ncbi:MAG: DUF1987 domain-containing protein [Cytophagales bacterium]|nr:DUF1987 domain-containing protein [Cytophagales bacterium]
MNASVLSNNLGTTLPLSNNVVRNFIINPTSVTPGVNLIPEKEYLLIKGRSCPDNALGFYNQIFDSLEDYKVKGYKNLRVFFNLEYFNTSSAKCLFILLKKLNSKEEGSLNLEVNWYYEEDDEDMYETGEDLSDCFDIKFNLLPVENY